MTALLAGVNKIVTRDERIEMTRQRPRSVAFAEGEPDHDALCEREQRYWLEAMKRDLYLSDHMEDAVKSLRIVVAADESVRSGQLVHI